MLKLVVNNRSAKGLAGLDEITPETCELLFNGIGYKILEHLDLLELYDESWLILSNGSVLKDWRVELSAEDVAFVTSEVDGEVFTEDDIVYEINPKHVGDLLQTIPTHPKPLTTLVGVDGGKESKPKDSKGMRQIRQNMKDFNIRNKRINSDRQSRNKKVR